MLSFLEGSVLIQLFVPFLTGFFFCCLSYVFSSIIQLFVLGFFFGFWCFVLLSSDLKVVFKRIIYLVLSWC